MDRLATARAALARAEENVGLAVQRGLLPVKDHAASPFQGATDSWQKGRTAAFSPAASWEVPPALRDLFPGGLVRGATYGVSGSPLLVLLLAGIASSHGAWTAFMGFSDIGWNVAELVGVNIAHTVIIPSNQHITASAVAAAIEGFDVVVLNAGVLLDVRERRLLARRALSHGTLVIAQGWETRERVIGVPLSVEGMSRGRGHITAIRMGIERPGRRHLLVRITARGWEAEEGMRVVPDTRFYEQRAHTIEHAQVVP
ncbi:MAG: hypothetical protein LKJ57_03640 [Ancrocorticia sp.]|nr:hypothetical protein [Ancrocorticia sp.]